VALDYLAIALVSDLDWLVALHSATGVLGTALFQTVVTTLATDLTEPEDRMLTLAVTHGIGFACKAMAPFCVGSLVHGQPRTAESTVQHPVYFDS
jgi:hypothetical protein